MFTRPSSASSTTAEDPTKSSTLPPLRMSMNNNRKNNNSTSPRNDSAKKSVGVQSPSPLKFVYNNSNSLILAPGMSSTDSGGSFPSQNKGQIRWSSEVEKEPSLFGLRKRNVPSHTTASESDNPVPATPAPPPKASISMGRPIEAVSWDERKHQTNTPFVQSSMFHGSPSPQKQQPALSNQIIVYGFPPSSQTSILQLFSSYGIILSRTEPKSSDGTSNWICLQYKNRLEAEKALCQDRTFLDGSRIILGVCRLDADMARRLGVGTSCTEQRGGFAEKGSAKKVKEKVERRENFGEMEGDELILLGAEDNFGRWTRKSFQNQGIGVWQIILSWVFDW